MLTTMDTEGSDASAPDAVPAPAAAAPKAVRGARGSKSAFVLGLPGDLGAKEVVAQAKQQGITIAEGYVYKIRSAAKGGAKPASTKAKTAKPASTSKAAFVRSLPPDVSYADAAAKAAAEGITLSKAHFYVLKSQTKRERPGESKGKPGRKPMVTAAPAPSRKGLRLSSDDAGEQAVIDAVMALGVSRARTVIDAVEKFERVTAQG